VDPDRLFGGGDSAGGNVTANLALRLQDNKRKQLDGMFLLYPSVDALQYAGGDGKQYWTISRVYVHLCLNRYVSWNDETNDAMKAMESSALQQDIFQVACPIRIGISPPVSSLHPH
jgi:acetyl esterase/lipase